MSARVPIVRRVSWIATIPVFLIVVVAVQIGNWTLGEYGGLIGTLSVFAYLLGMRSILTKDHRTGIGLVKREQFSEAIPYFQKSLAFFDRYSWIDRYRSIFLMSLSAACYREMAIANTAFCYSQTGDGVQAKRHYEECLRRFPDCGIAITALRMLDARS